MTSKEPSPSYEFSEKYTPDHAVEYLEKHDNGFWRRLSTWREIGMARKALHLAGNPKSVLDLPCGTGRFWEMLAESPDRIIFAADNSQAMIDTGMQHRPGPITARIAKAFQCSAFGTGLPDDFVECVFCIRLLHHIQQREDRVRILKEFARISSGTVIVSLWVDGNYRAWRHKRKQTRKLRRGEDAAPRDRLLLPRSDIEAEFAEAGLQVVGSVDFLKYWDKWRAYVLRVGR